MAQVKNTGRPVPAYDPHRIMMMRHVCYRFWHYDPAGVSWRVWVVMPNAESAFGTGATVREAYYMAESTARRCRPRPFLPQRYEWANKKRGYGLSMDLTAVVRNIKRRPLREEAAQLVDLTRSGI